MNTAAAKPATSAGEVQAEINSLGEILGRDGVIPQQKAKALSAPHSMAEIPSALRDQGIDDESIMAALYARFSGRFELFNPETHAIAEGARRSAPREGDWVISGGVFWMVNPYDPLAVECTKRYRLDERGAARFERRGLMTPAQFQKAGESLFADITHLDPEASDQAAEQEADRLFEYIMEMGCSREASDIHLNPGKQVQIKMRIDGRLIPIKSVPLDATYRRMANVLMAKCTREATYNMPSSGEFRYDYNGKTVSVRLEMCPCKTGTSLEPRFTLRLNGLNTSRKQIASLGFSGKQVGQLRRFSHMPHGLVLVTGPTGSGKSTTLYALLQDIAMHSPYKAIFTLEDPVEQLIAQFQQIEMRGQMTFGDGLRSLLRQDPDVLLVGEIRDDETANLALKGANTGHLVFSTLHTNNSHGSLERMMDLGCKRSFLAEALKAVTAQRMVDIVCQSCSKKVLLGDVPAYAERYGKLSGLWSPSQEVRVANEAGCQHCFAGYRGRHPVQEIFVLDNMARDMLLQNAIPAQIREAQIEAGTFETLWADGYRLVAEGKTTFEALAAKLDLEEAMMTKDTIASIKKENLRTMNNGAGSPPRAAASGSSARVISQIPVK